MNESPIRLADKDADKNRQIVTNIKWNAEQMAGAIRLAIKHGHGDKLHLEQALIHLEVADMLATKGLLADAKH